jgi:hypothetical protein
MRKNEKEIKHNGYNSHGWGQADATEEEKKGKVLLQWIQEG